jgi:hypothetical protein
MPYQPPDPSVVRANLQDPSANRSFTAADFQHYNSEARRVADYNVDNAAYLGARKIVEPSSTNPTYSPHNPFGTPFSAIPPVGSRKEHYEAIAVFGDDPSAPMSAGQYLVEDDASLPGRGPAQGWTYTNYANQPSPYGGPNGQSGEPTAVTQIPTSTTDPTRPRTVAAGYDHTSQTLTIVFRDGTYYNYYNVNQAMWNNFRASYSPGRFILQHLDKLPRGVADVSDLTEDAREALYRATRTGQILNDGLTGSQSATARRRKVQNYRPGNLGGTGRKRAKLTSQKLTGT